MSDFTKYHAMLAQLRATNSTKDKTAIIKAHIVDPNIMQLLRMAYDPYRPYYVGEGKLSTLCSPGLVPLNTGTWDANIDDFTRVADSLTHRKVTGNAALELIRDTLNRYSPETAAEIVRILLKDIGAGITAKTINAGSVAAGLGAIIPVFSIQLAHPVGDRLQKLEYPVWCDYKHDGERTIIDASQGAREGSYIPYSREGRIQDANLDLWEAEIAAIAKHLDHDSIVLDCETIDTSFKGVAKGKGKDADKSSRKLIIFDILTGEEWAKKSCALTQMSRRVILEDLVEMTELPRIEIPVGRICNNLAEVEAFFAEAVAAGLEGIMIKTMDGMYEYKRSWSWLKFKPTNTADGKITLLNLGKEGGKWEGQYGSYTAIGSLEDGTPFEVNVGSGLTLAQLTDINQNPDKYLHHHVELKYDCVSFADDSSIASLRFPRHKKMRPDLD